MAVNCTKCPLRELSCFVPMTKEEVAFMDRFKVGEMEIEPQTVFLQEGAKTTQLYTVLSGVGLRYKLLPDGNRQVLNFIYPGDFVGMQAGLLGEMKHSAQAATQMKLCVFDRKNLWTLFKSHPDRAFDITWLAAVEEHFLGGNLAALGQRSGRERLAWALVRIYHRSDQLGLMNGEAVKFPFKQQDLADALGLSLVHTNKTLARFRLDGLVSWSDGKLTYHDVGQLEDIATTNEDEHREQRPLM